MLCRPELHEALAGGLRELRAIFHAGPSVAFGQGDALMEAGKPTEAVFMLRRGWACRMRRLSQGRKSIIDVYLPGDFIGVDTGLMHRAPDRVMMLSPGAVQTLDATQTLPALFTNPTIAVALAWSANEAQRRVERIAAAIRRYDGQERIALALVDFHIRLRRRQLISGLSYHLPMTQRQIGDYVGMTSIHVNRVLRSLREAKMAVVVNHVVMLTDPARLARLAGIEEHATPEASGLLKSRRTATAPSDECSA
jgi:CRP-like cAMP-binding protein